MTLPAAPVEVLTEIHINLPWLDDHDLDAVAATVWPYLYAAALRHAAEEMTHEGRCAPGDCLCGVGALRRMADEATV